MYRTIENSCESVSINERKGIRNILCCPMLGLLNFKKNQVKRGKFIKLKITYRNWIIHHHLLFIENMLAEFYICFLNCKWRAYHILLKVSHLCISISIGFKQCNILKMYCIFPKPKYNGILWVSLYTKHKYYAINFQYRTCHCKYQYNILIIWESDNN